MNIDFDSSIEELKKNILEGHREFLNTDFGDGELRNMNLQGIKFHNCILAIDFSGSDLSDSVFMNSNIKTSIFVDVKLDNATIVCCSVEGIDLSGARTIGIKFENNTCYSVVVGFNEIECFTSKT